MALVVIAVSGFAGATITLIRRLILRSIRLIVLMAGIRERLRYSDIPAGLQGTGITFIIMGLMAMSFMGISGIRLGVG